MQSSPGQEHTGSAVNSREIARAATMPKPSAALASAPTASPLDKPRTIDGSLRGSQTHNSPKFGTRHILILCLAAVASCLVLIVLWLLLRGQEAHRPGTCSDTEEQLLVKTSLGEIRGVAVETSNGQRARVFRGIPFGEGTTGGRRFELATKVTKLRSPFAAVKQGPACLQPSIHVPVLRSVTVMSDNCLTLNVWAPSRCSMEKGQSLPVLFFLGGWMFHVASWNGLFDWSTMASHGRVIVVSPNFRLGAAGFLHRNGTGPDNVGVEDILLAWNWTKEHIASFGGNASNVVPLGHSSGGFVVSALLARPELFDANRSVILSQSMFTLTPDNSGEKGVRKTEFLGELCCNRSSCAAGRSIPEYVRCLAFLPAAELVDMLKLRFSLAQINLDGGPFFFADARKLPDDRSFFAGKDVLLGNTIHEADRVLAFGIAVQNLTDSGVRDIVKFLARQIGFPEEKVLKYLGPYLALDDDSASRFEKLEKLNDLFTKGAFQCPMLQYATEAAKGGANVRFMVLAEEKMDAVDRATGDGVATYGDDLRLLSGDPTYQSLTTPQSSLSHTMMGHVAAFASSGNPGHISATEEWPPFTEAEKKVVLLNSSVVWAEAQWHAQPCGMLMEILSLLLSGGL
ncbi:acetylcholinesterase-like [Dermacentor andersoni]|uniref:acetylcholinesterase-like n=1 Tax=Dermacentor andersoni TaxID=34620 RepID=UPI00215566E8|nr:cholinesterase-like [Dermacentor andersoni]